MLIIQDILVSDDLIEEQFLCNLKICKGACCWEGDFGARLETEELHALERIYDDIKPFLTNEGKKAIAEQGLFTYNKTLKEYATPLINNAACVFMTYDHEGIAKCGIEKAYEAGVTDFQKPVSCHLYPIRVSQNKKVGFEALNYEKWDICSAACELGKKEKMPVFKFVKDALIRKFGKEFFEELESAVAYIRKI